MLLSVIMPVYNVEDTLKRAVDSVLNQTAKDFELILVDDGSTDNSGKICDELSKTDARIRVIHKVNGGLSSARNVGIDAATGDYISFIDSDDYFERTLFASFFAELDKHPDLDMYRFNVVRVTGSEQARKQSIDSVSDDKEQNIAMLFDYAGVDFYAWNKIYARSLFKDIRFPEGKLYEDIITTYETTKLANKVVTTDKVGIYYIANPASIVASEFNPKQYANVTERVTLLNRVEREYPALTDRALEKVLDGFLSTGYKISSSKASEVTDAYYKILKEDSHKYLPLMSHNSEISKLKLVALRILLFNLSLFGKLYKFYLRK